MFKNSIAIDTKKFRFYSFSLIKSTQLSNIFHIAFHIKFGWLDKFENDIKLFVIKNYILKKPKKILLKIINSKYILYLTAYLVLQ